MAGSHQIWVFDRIKDISYRVSGTGDEGNLNTVGEKSEWA